jgi:hypothetical protein
VALTDFLGLAALKGDDLHVRDIANLRLGREVGLEAPTHNLPRKGGNERAEAGKVRYSLRQDKSNHWRQPGGAGHLGADVGVSEVRDACLTPLLYENCRVTSTNLKSAAGASWAPPKLQPP